MQNVVNYIFVMYCTFVFPYLLFFLFLYMVTTNYVLDVDNWDFEPVVISDSYKQRN